MNPAKVTREAISQIRSAIDRYVSEMDTLKEQESTTDVDSNLDTRHTFWNSYTGNIISSFSTCVVLFLFSNHEIT